MDAATVVASSVTVVGCGFRQLHARERREAGWRCSRFFNFLSLRSTQLVAALAVTLTVGVTTAVRICRGTISTSTGCPPTVTVSVTVASATSVTVVVCSTSTVVMLFWY
jgi:hypothetical protein